MTRKTPIQHLVKAHTRMGKLVKSFIRGKGEHPQRQTRSKEKSYFQASYRYRYIHDYFSEYAERKGIKPTPENYKKYIDGLLKLQEEGKIEMSLARISLREKHAKQTNTLKVSRMIEKFYRNNRDYHPYFMLRELGDT